MRIVAGIDVGNTTTEVVLADASLQPPRPIAWDRAPTRGRKGSEQALHGGAWLVRRLANRTSLVVSEAVLAPQRPVDTTVEVRPRRMPATGRLCVVTTGSTTPGRVGSAAGRPAVVAGYAPPPGALDGPVVALVRAGTGYLDAAAWLTAWVTGGVDVRAVLVADDEGVLVAARVAVDGPVLDRVDVDRAARAQRLAVEVCAPGAACAQLSDPLRLVTLLGLGAPDHAHAAIVARELGDTANAVVALMADDAALGALPPTSDTTGSAPHGEVTPTDDVWSVDLDALTAVVQLPRDPGHRFGTAIAALSAQEPAGSALLAARLSAALDVPVRTAASEAAAARAGALSSPAVAATAGDALVLDLGGGTLDAIGAGGAAQSIVAGGGELVTACVAAVLGLPRGAAEWVKRGPCGRLESPYVLLGEDGGRTFLEQAAPGAATGSLVVAGPAGWLPFSRTLAPAQWRAVRLAVKQKALGRNISRAIAGLDTGLHSGLDTGVDSGPPGHVVLVGGVAGDGELLRALGPELDAVLPGALVGRGDVAGVLGHRWAVAYGLTLCTELCT